MIDTIRYKLLNFQSYGDVALNLINKKTIKNGHMKFSEFGKAHEQLRVDDHVKCKLTSASYEINYSVHLSLDYVQFEYSVPKYTYGHNTKEFPLPEFRNDAYEALIYHLTEFFLVEFKMLIDVKDIEIERVDFCYNYIFASLVNKELYMNHSNQLFKSEFKTNSVITYSDNETSFFHTKDYSFKIYDKYKEFIKHDYKSFKKHFGNEKTTEILQTTQNMVRCEMTYRKPKISYEFFQDMRNTTQLGARFKNRLRIVKKETKIVEKILEQLSDKINLVFQRKLDYSDFISFIESLRVKHNSKRILSLDALLSTVRLLMLKNDFTIFYTPIELDYIINRTSLSMRAEYYEMIRPRKLRMELTKLEKTYNKQSAPQELHLDRNLFKTLQRNFEDVITSLNSFETSNISPLLAISKNKELLKELKISYSALAKYLDAVQRRNDKELIKKGIYAKSTIQNHKKNIERINTALMNSSRKSRISKYKLPEKITLKVA